VKKVNEEIIRLLLLLENFDASVYDESFLRKTLENRITEAHCESELAYYDYLQQSHIEAQQFIISLSVSYTEFFRNSLTFAVLEKIVLPNLYHKKLNSKQHEIRIWSAACASGQETYSLAMLLQEIGNHDSLKYRIFATDQSKIQIEAAQNGTYPLSALNLLNIQRLNKFFTKHGHFYTIIPELKEKIEFSNFDLLDKELSSPPSSIFGNFDIIFCANILFYYDIEHRKEIIDKLRKCLAKDGYLITGETERDILAQHRFDEVIKQSAIFRK
jgi:chemotaxis methyl-accepting protein methylase